MSNVLRNAIQAFLPLDDLHYAGRRVFQEFLLPVVQFLLLTYLVDVGIEPIIGQAHLRHPSTVKQRHRIAVLYRLSKVVFRHIIAKPLVGEPPTAQKRSTRKGNIVGIRQSRVHILGKLLVLGAMSLIY